MSLFISLRKMIRSLLGKDKPSKEILRIYANKDYLDAYSHHTDQMIKVNPKAAIGGRWEKMGMLQFDFLIHNGLQANHKMLDLGCGTLRGGQHFIQYLNPGNYYGVDISTNAIAFGTQLVQKKGLENKQPHLLVLEKKDLKFEELAGEKFDYILAQSVFTHLKPNHIKECFEHIGNIMHEDSAFYFTYRKTEEYKQVAIKDFGYPFSFFEELASKYNFRILDCSEDYPHPNGQIMVKLSIKA